MVENGLISTPEIKVRIPGANLELFKVHIFVLHLKSDPKPVRPCKAPTPASASPGLLLLAHSFSFFSLRVTAGHVEIPPLHMASSTSL